MAVCPRCGADISFLKVRELRLYESDFTYCESGFEERNVKIETVAKFLCPICLQELFDISEQGKAEDFLRGG
ncbi:MAG: hypothetical protein QXT64_06250 [Desulfurococcaceae archaeon]